MNNLCMVSGGASPVSRADMAMFFTCWLLMTRCLVLRWAGNGDIGCLGTVTSSVIGAVSLVIGMSPLMEETAVQCSAFL